MLSQNEYELTTAERVSAFFHLNDLLYMAGGTAFVFLCALVVEELPLAWNVADDIFQSGGIWSSILDNNVPTKLDWESLNETLDLY